MEREREARGFAGWKPDVCGCKPEVGAANAFSISFIIEVVLSRKPFGNDTLAFESRITILASSTLS